MHLVTCVHTFPPFTTMGTRPGPHTSFCTLPRRLYRSWVVRSPWSPTWSPSQEGAKGQCCANTQGALGEAVDQVCPRCPVDCTGGRREPQEERAGPASRFSQRQQRKIRRSPRTYEQKLDKSTKLVQQHPLHIPSFAFCSVSVTQVNSSLKILTNMSRNKRFIHFKLLMVLSSLVKSPTAFPIHQT